MTRAMATGCPVSTSLVVMPPRRRPSARYRPWPFPCGPAPVAARVDAGYPSNTDLVLEGGRPVLRRRKGADRRPEALQMEAAIHDRLPQRELLDILTRTAYLLGWHHHFGPASGSDPKIRDTLARYVLTVFAHGTLLGPAQVAAHMRSQVSVHELTLAANKHATAAKIEKASATVINAFSKLDVTAMWGDGKTAAAGLRRTSIREKSAASQPCRCQYAAADRVASRETFHVDGARSAH